MDLPEPGSPTISKRLLEDSKAATMGRPVASVAPTNRWNERRVLLPTTSERLPSLGTTNSPLSQLP
jgi:hypothetical protein